MKILHTSDWHIGKYLYEVNLIEEQQHVLSQLIKVIEDEKPDLLIIAGDIYDRAIPMPESIRLVDEIITKIILDFKLPIIIISGNHDSPDRLAFGSKIFSSNKLFIKTSINDVFEPLFFADEYGEVVFWTIPYIPIDLYRAFFNSEISDYNLAISMVLSKIKEKMDRGKRNFIISHIFVNGGTKTESERTFSVGGTDVVEPDLFKDFIYVACGHLHKPQKISQNIYYSGSIYKYSFSESDHKKYFNLVYLEKQNYKLEQIEIRFKRDVRVIEGRLEDIIKNADKDNSRDDYILAVLKDKGILYEPMVKLRSVYKNVLRIERSFVNLENTSRIDYKTINKENSPQKLFERFFKDMTMRDLTDLERDIVNDVISEVIKETK